MWESIKHWFIVTFALLGAAAATFFALMRGQEKQEDQNEQQDLKAYKEKALHETYTKVEDIARDPDPDRRNKRAEEWIHEGVE